MNTLPGANPIRSWADFEADMAGARDQRAMAQQLMSAGYVPNSGGLGALAQFVSAFAGNKLKTQSDKKLADLIREEYQLKQADETSAAQKRMEEENRAFQEKIKAAVSAGYSPGQAEAIARGIQLPKAESRKALQFSNGVIFDPNTGEAKRTEFYQPPQGPVADKPPADIQVLQAYMKMTPEERAAFDRIQGREVGPAQLSAKDQQANEMRGISVDNALNIVGQMEAMTSQGVGGPLEAMVPFKGLTNPKFEEYEALRNQAVDEITRLRRVPGIGSQSDRELASLLAAIPGADTNESTRVAAFKNIRRVLEDIASKIGAGPVGGESLRDSAQNRAISGGASADQFAGFSIRRKSP